MSFRRTASPLFILSVLAACIGFASTAFGQAASLHGRVTDPSGAVISSAAVSVSTGNGPALVVAVTDKQGDYTIKGLAPGKYTVTVTAQGFAPVVRQSVTVNGAQTLDFHLALEVEQQQVQVSSEAVRLDTSPSQNASATVIRGKDLEALPDDPDELATDIQALAGPSVGPNGGQLYIDGFTGGDLPPKSSIREIRINQNPFSAEFDTLGYGRIEVFTKPGTDKFHGELFFDGNDAPFNARNPLVFNEPPYHSTFFSGNVGGPLSKSASFFLNVERRDISDLSIINTDILDSNLNIVPYSATVRSPRTRTNITPRFDLQLGSSNTLTARYQYMDDSETNNGVGLFSLPSQAFNTHNVHHSLQVSDTEVLSARVINETRFEFLHFNNNQLPQNFDPTINVVGAFTTGGNNQGTDTRSESHYEVQNYTSIALNRHFLRLGGMLRDIKRIENANGDFNGTFTFGPSSINPQITALNNYRQTLLDLASGMSMAQIQSSGYGPTQFSIIAGVPLATVNRLDGSLFAEDDWKIRPNLTASYGLRFESQNAISDHADWAPRVGLAWGIGGAQPKTVLRAGFGVFYERFDDDQMMQAERLNGINQQQYIIANPSFYVGSIPPTSMLAGANSSVPTVYRIDPNLRAPYIMTSALGLERQVTKNATASVTYVNSRGVHGFLTNDVNAPLPGTYDPTNPTSGVRPFGDAAGNIYQFESVGIFKQNQLISNFNIRGGRRFSLFGVYTLNYANSDTAGVNSFPANPWDIAANYGRAAFDVRHRLFFGGTISAPLGLTFSPFIFASSGSPFSITLGQDLYGTGQFNARPAYATSSTPANDLRVTPYGNFAINPTAAETIVAPNIGTGPAAFTANLRVSKTFGFGGEKQGGGGSGQGGEGGGGHRHGGEGLGGRGLSGGGGFNPFGGGQSTNRRYNLNVGISFRNLFNNVNFAPPVGVLSSPLFGRSVALAGGPFSMSAANRRIDLQARFTF